MLESVAFEKVSSNLIIGYKGTKGDHKISLHIFLLFYWRCFAQLFILAALSHKNVHRAV